MSCYTDNFCLPPLATGEIVNVLTLSLRGSTRESVQGGSVATGHSSSRSRTQQHVVYAWLLYNAFACRCPTFALERCHCRGDNGLCWAVNRQYHCASPCPWDQAWIVTGVTSFIQRNKWKSKSSRPLIIYIHCYIPPGFHCPSITSHCVWMKCHYHKARTCSIMQEEYIFIPRCFCSLLLPSSIVSYQCE